MEHFYDTIFCSTDGLIGYMRASCFTHITFRVYVYLYIHIGALPLFPLWGPPIHRYVVHSLFGSLDGRNKYLGEDANRQIA